MPMPSIIDEKREQADPLSATPWTTRRPLEQLYEVPRRPRSRAAIWLSLAALAAAGAYGFYSVYPRLNRQGDALSKLTSLPGLFDVLSGRVASIEQKVAGIPAGMESLRERMGGVDQRVLNGLNLAKQNIQTVGVALRRDLLATNARQATTDARVTHLESTQRAEAARTTALEQQLAQQNDQLKRQVADLSSRLASASQDARVGEQHLQRQIEQTGRRAAAEATSFQNRPRTRFEAIRGRSLEVAPGILLHIAKTDIGHRRFAGWLQLVESGKFLWLRDESVLQTIAFYAGEKTLRHDLVVTDLNKDGVTGYVIFPSQAESGVSRP